MKALISTLFFLTLSLQGLAQQKPSLIGPDFLADVIAGLDDDVPNATRPPHGCTTCNQPQIVPFEREHRIGLTFPLSQNFPGADCVNEIVYSPDPNRGPRYQGGVRVCMNAGSRSRELLFRAIDGSREGATMYFTEAISSADSANYKTQLLMLPRRSIPNAQLVGNELRITLSTGELVVLDATTKARIRGPLSFGPIGTTPRPTPYSYTGSGIVISAVQHGPSIMPFEPHGSTVVSVKQGNQSCNVPRERLFNASGNPIAGTDAAMLATLNQFCTPRPAQPFHL